jgi:hypothetical protein
MANITPGPITPGKAARYPLLRKNAGWAPRGKSLVSAYKFKKAKFGEREKEKSSKGENEV